jgi:hypothetical protein
MSVYSGFSTRIQEASYYKLVESLIYLLQAKVLFCLKTYPRPEDTTWLQRFNSIYNNLKEMEFHKYLEPKLSNSCKGLANYFSIDSSIDNFERVEFEKFTQPRNGNYTKPIVTPRPKVYKEKVKSKAKERISEGKGMSKYYGRIMDNFLAQPKSVSPIKKSKATLSMDSQDFWLLDDKITLIDNDLDL